MDGKMPTGNPGSEVTKGLTGTAPAEPVENAGSGGNAPPPPGDQSQIPPQPLAERQPVIGADPATMDPSVRVSTDYRIDETRSNLPRQDVAKVVEGDVIVRKSSIAGK